MSDSTAVLRARIDLPTTTASVPVARHLVAQLLAAWSAKARHEESMLLLSELVTNVVRHVRPTTTFTIELILSQLKLRVSVVDGSPTPPVMLDRSPAGGHGMWLVTAIADRWGSGRHGTGKQVWFELDR
jgi:anti-sigma regulatory factor (Ser/Thr protein kinase)